MLDVWAVLQVTPEGAFGKGTTYYESITALCRHEEDAVEMAATLKSLYNRLEFPVRLVKRNWDVWELDKSE